jgi:WD40 repeat protein
MKLPSKSFPKFIKPKRVKTIQSMILSPNNSIALILFTDHEDVKGNIGVYNFSKMKMEYQFESLECKSMVLNHNGTILNVGTSKGTIEMFDMNSKNQILEWTAHVGEISSICLSYDETSIFSIGKDGNVKISNF